MQAVLNSFQIDKFLVINSLFIGFVILIIFYIGKIWYSYRFFKKRGIKNPDYEFFYGNFRQLIKNKNYSDVLRNWTNELGKTYGYYEGHEPILVTSDIDILQEIFIKQSSNFSARKKLYLSRRDNDPKTDLFLSTKTRWKRMRTIMNPAFSSAKLRELSPILSSCSDRLIKILGENIEKEVNLTQFFKRFTMDSIWSGAFGVDTDMQYDYENEYFNKCEANFKMLSNLILPQYLGIYFHEFKVNILDALTLISRVMTKLADEKKLLPIYWLRMKIGELVRLRMDQKGIKRKDLIQLLIDASADFENEENFDYYDLKKVLTPDEVEANLILIMLAGYDTTSNCLLYVSHVLSTHPNEQEKLFNEITSKFSSESDQINSDNVQELNYLDWVIKEVLRLYPIANPIINRRCTKATTVKGIEIPVDLPIAVDVLSLHFDPDLWGPVDPNKFYPERHEVKRNPLAFMGFGNGPRNCIGMKFALIEIKIALIKMLLNFEILPAKETKLEIEEVTARQPKNGVKVILRKRNHTISLARTIF